MTLFSVPEQKETVDKLHVVIDQFSKSKGQIRPHFLLTGGTGSGKTANISALAKHSKAKFIEINAAQLTAEGISGNSLSKALKPLENMQNTPVICLVDEADKLFTNGSGGKATNGSIDVQNEFLKILESDSISVIGDYGHYNSINSSRVLYVFAGAFGGKEGIDTEELAKMGVRPEFIGRLAAIFEMPNVSLESYIKVAKNHDLLEKYYQFNPTTLANQKAKLNKAIAALVTERYEGNALGLRMVGNTIHEVMIDALLKEHG